jgi:hypothetical protein
MKYWQDQTELWRFPVMGEETWAGAEARRATAPATSTIHPLRRSDHVTPTQQFTPFS